VTASVVRLASDKIQSQGVRLKEGGATVCNTARTHNKADRSNGLNEHFYASQCVKPPILAIRMVELQVSARGFSMELVNIALPLDEICNRHQNSCWESFWVDPEEDGIPWRAQDALPRRHSLCQIPWALIHTLPVSYPEKLTTVRGLQLIAVGSEDGELGFTWGA
jgi:hypothetical protein